MTSATCPVVGYLFPAFDLADDSFDPVALAAELAEMEAAPHTDEYDDAFDFYYDMSDAELAQLYANRCS